MKNFLENIFSMIEKKRSNLLRAIGEEKVPAERIMWDDYKIYVEAMKNELEELEAELRPNNHVYLEDELADVLWDYINSLYFLDQQGYIEKERVFSHCLKKYQERTEKCESGMTWNEVKKEQKEKLQQEHESKYGKLKL